ncbi:MAG: DNA repair protein RecO [Candidatus Omnitrophota bacterium]
MPLQKAEAIVLNKYDFRETSLIVNFYTRQFGKLSGLLKGFRREHGKFASTLEPFSYNEIIFYHKRNSDLHLVSQCDLRYNFDAVRQDVSRAGLSNLMMELVNTVMPAEEENEEVFELSILALREIEKIRDPHKIITAFNIKMLALSGFKPHFDSCVCCGSKISGQAKFSFSFGGLLCPRCCLRDKSARNIYRGTVATILHIERNDFLHALKLGMNPQIKKELELVLNTFLNLHLGKELRSRKVLGQMGLL